MRLARQIQQAFRPNQPVLVGFRSVYVFDVAQTEGKELPEIASKVTGNVGEYRERLIEFTISRASRLSARRASPRLSG